MSRIENFYIGGQEYMITFRNGTHHVEEIENEVSTIVFSGNYEQCLEKQQALFEEYLEERF